MMDQFWKKKPTLFVVVIRLFKLKLSFDFFIKYCLLINKKHYFNIKKCVDKFTRPTFALCSWTNVGFVENNLIRLIDGFKRVWTMFYLLRQILNLLKGKNNSINIWEKRFKQNVQAPFELKPWPLQLSSTKFKILTSRKVKNAPVPVRAILNWTASMLVYGC